MVSRGNQSRRRQHITGILNLALTLDGRKSAVGSATFRSKRLGRLDEGRPQLIIHNGHVHRDVMETEQLTQDELDAAIRLAGCAFINDVHVAIRENNGQTHLRMRR